MLMQFRYSLWLSFFWLSYASPSAAQDNSIDGQPESLEGYLQQAFAAPQAENRLALAHIGIQGEDTESGFLVTAVLEGYPAFSAGIYRGDIIEAAAGEPFHPIMSFNERAGKSVSLTIRRGDSTLILSVQPILENLYDSYRTATINSIQEFSAGNKVIGYLRPWALSKNTADLISFTKLLEQLNHCDALIFDLRNAYGFADQLHSNSLMSNENDIDYFEKSVVILFNEETAEGPMSVIRKVMHLTRIDTLAAAPHLGVDPEMTIPYPKTQTSRYDPQYDAALNRLLGII